MTKIINTVPLFDNTAEYINDFIVGDVFIHRRREDTWILVAVEYDFKSHNLNYTLTTNVFIEDEMLYEDCNSSMYSEVTRNYSQLLEDFDFYRRFRGMPNQISQLCNYCPMYKFDPETCNICNEEYEEFWDLNNFFLIGDMCMRLKKGVNGILKYGLGFVFKIKINSFNYLTHQVINSKKRKYSLIPYYELYSDGIQRKGIICPDECKSLGGTVGEDLHIYLRRGRAIEYDKKRNLCGKVCIYTDCLNCRIKNL